jgi:hypothetical protein
VLCYMCCVCRAAAAAGNLPLLQWLQSEPQLCALHSSVALAAAETCQREVLQWLIDDAGCPYYLDVLWHVAFTKAAAAGNAAGIASDMRAADRWRELFSYIDSLPKQQ